ncbi:hypothetical protein O9992_05765 [Vibrio lentus]|nr:hypothetical protein [Vibrio lentus]
MSDKEGIALISIDRFNVLSWVAKWIDDFVGNIDFRTTSLLNAWCELVLSASVLVSLSGIFAQNTGNPASNGVEHGRAISV